MSNLLKFWLQICLPLLLINGTSYFVSANLSGQQSSERRAPLDYETAFKNLVSTSRLPGDEFEKGELVIKQGGDLWFLHRCRNTNVNSIVAIPNNTSDWKCDWKSNLAVTQNLFSYLPMAIFHVAVTNICQDCHFLDIHIACGEFNSATLVDPAIFNRIADNECLVNNGGPMGPLEVVTFECSSLFASPVEISRATRECESVTDRFQTSRVEP